jgi:hypothetical protein
VAVFLPASQDPRYFYPLVPVLLLYVCEAAMNRLALSGVVAMLLAASCISGFANADWGPNRQGPDNPGFKAVSGYLRQHARPEAVFVFAKPRLLGLVTGHSTAAVAPDSGNDIRRSYLKEIHADYVVTASDFAEDENQWKRFAEANPEMMQQVFAQQGFVVWQTDLAR